MSSPDALLYRSFRYGLWGGFTYSIPVANGNYTLTLKFAELIMSSKGMRVFNVTVNNAPVLTNFDVMAETNAMYTPLDKTFPITVTGGVANIQFQGVLGLPMVSAIALVPSGSTPPPPPPSTLTISRTSGTVVAGQNLQFTASGGATWTTTAGSISSNGLLTAPANISTSTSVTVTATSTTLSSTTAQATVTVTPVPVAPTLTVTPTSGTVVAGQTLQFNASSPVTWSAGSGSITSAGLFTAPTSVLSSTTVTIVATSTSNTSLTALASVTVTPVVVAPPPQTGGIIGYWSYDSAKMTGNQVLDSSGNSINGTVSGGITSTQGPVNQAITLNGVNGSIVFPYRGLTNLATSMTLASWIKTTNASRSEGVLSHYNAAGTETGYVFRTDSSGHIELLIGGNTNATGGQKLLVDAGKVINDGQWHHVAATLVLGRGVSFYIDGQLSSTFALGLTSAKYAGSFSIGVNPYTPYGNYFTGSLDETYVYSRVLLPSEIAALAQTTTTPNSTPTLSAAPASLNFTALAGSSAAGQSLALTSSSALGLIWTATASQSWITLGATSGTTTSTITVGANTAGLTAGNTYNGTITVASPGSGAASQTIAVSLTVTQTTPVAPPPTTTGAQWYVSPSGSPSGNGSATNPWDLTTALLQPSVVKPGDTIWLRGGTYGTQPVSYTSKLTGTGSQPIIVKQYPGERATIDGNIAIYAPYTWYWGFEVTNSSGARSVGEPLLECIDTYPGSAGVKLINLVLHDCDQGIGFWVGATDAEANGNIIYYVGQSGQGRGEGHAIYTQNQTGTKHIIDNIMFDAFDIGFQAYGSGAAFVQNYDLDGNVSFNNGGLQGVHVDNILFAVGSGLQNISVANSYTYHTPSANSGYSRLGWQFGGGNGSLASNGNYWIGGHQSLQLWSFQNVTGSGNVFYSNNSLMLQMTPGGNGLSGYTWDHNTYYGSGLLQLSGSNTGFSSWAGSTGLDVHSTFTPGRPTGTWTFVRPNKYDAGRANIIIYNWSLAPSVAVSLSAVLQPGDSYAIHDVFNFFGTPVASGIYSGAPVSIPMTGLTVSSPIGWSAPNHTAPEFGAFVVTKQ